MNIVLLSGGSGKRLWPLSNDVQSKQFLKLLKDEKGNDESMVQRVMRQLLSEIPDANVYVSCNNSQVDMLHKQLGNVNVISEPVRRDTFPAIALAAAHLHFNNRLGEDETFVACPIDVFAENAYFSLLSQVNELCGAYNIGLLGAVPTYPSEKYGYITHDNGTVSGFVEKPPLGDAVRLVESKALWNCGVASVKIGYVLGHARKHVEFGSYGSLYAQYEKLPKISFDYEVIEKETSIGVVVYQGIWKDLGTWNTFAEEMGRAAVGDALVSDCSVNTHTLNMLNIPIIVQDIRDAVIVASYDGILVSSKPGSSHLKPLTEQITNKPMYEQKHWGSYRILECKQDDKTSSVVRRIHVDAGQVFNRECNNECVVIWAVTNGKGIVTIDGNDSVVSPGSIVNIPCNTLYTIQADIFLEFIEIEIGNL